MSSVATRTVDCPSCGQPVTWTTESRFRPFCSARCKGMDLGAWASGQYRVAGSEMVDATALLPDQTD